MWRAELQPWRWDPGFFGIREGLGGVGGAGGINAQQPPVANIPPPPAPTAQEIARFLRS